MTTYLLIYGTGALIVMASAVAGYYFKMPLRPERSRSFYFFALVLVSVLWTVIFSLMKDLTVLSHHSYLDFAVFLEYFDKFSRGGHLFSSIQDAAISGNGHWFANHFTPMIYFFGYTYKMIPSFHTVNWLQTAFLATSPLILYWFSSRMLGPFSAFCISLTLLLNPTFQYITLYEFEYLRFVIPVGILAVGMVVGYQTFPAVVLASIAVLFIREDAAFLVVGIGLYVTFFQKGRRVLGMVLILLALCYLYVAMDLVMPLFREKGAVGHVAASSFQKFGNSLPEIITSVVREPLAFANHLFHPYKTINWLMYLLPFSLVPLAGAKMLLVAIPTLALLSFSNSVSHTSYFLYYISPILVAVVWATVDGVNTVSQKSWIGSKLTTLWPALSLSKERLAFSVLLGSLACSIYFGPSPVSLQFWWKDFSLAPFRTTTFYMDRYLPTDHDRIVRKLSMMIPAGASVSAEQFLLVDVYKCKEVRVFPYIQDVEYVLIDKKNPRKTGVGVIGAWDGLRNSPQFYYDWMEKRPDIFELVDKEDGVFLFKRKEGSPSYPQPQGVPR